MAENPAIITCPADTWVKVADGVLVGTIHRRSRLPGVYFQTVRVAGALAPTDNSEVVSAFDGCDELNISSDAPIDVYIKALRVAGEVRVDL